MIRIGDRLIGTGQPCFIIAEAGVNHNGNVESALQLIDAAAESGADAVKFQTFSTDRLVTGHAPKADYQKETTDSEESQYAMLKRLELGPAEHRRLLAHARSRGIVFLSTPFDESSADLLLELGLAAIKVGSGDLTNLPLLEHIARHGKPMIVSTGMAYLSEVEDAVRCVRAQGDIPLVLLHCLSNYPARPSDVNLNAMLTMRQAFGVPVGYSDHTIGPSVAVAAVALGASVIEKHLTLDRSLPGPDHQASMEPSELRALVEAIRDVESALGDGMKRPTAEEAATAAVARKSIVSRRAIPEGTLIRGDMLDLKRPATGIAPRWLAQVVGRAARVDIPADTPLQWEMI